MKEIFYVGVIPKGDKDGTYDKAAELRDVLIRLGFDAIVISRTIEPEERFSIV